MNYVSRIEEHARTNFLPEKLQHAYRVRENALRISEEMETDKEIIEIAALLHESGSTPMESSMKALALLSEIEYNEHKKHKVAKLIHNHPFDSFILEQRILFEADKFEHKEKSLTEKIRSFLGFK